MRLLTVAFPIESEAKWTELTESARREYGVLPVIQKDVVYGRGRIARATMWKKCSD